MGELMDGLQTHAKRNQRVNQIKSNFIYRVLFTLKYIQSAGKKIQNL